MGYARKSGSGTKLDIIVFMSGLSVTQRGCNAAVGPDRRSFPQGFAMEDRALPMRKRVHNSHRGVANIINATARQVSRK